MGLRELRPARLQWPKTQRRRLRELKKLGFMPLEISRMDLLGQPVRSLWAIRKQWGRMKLADRKRARRMKNKRVWKPEEKCRFQAFLLRNSATMTPEEIGKIWGVARSTVANQQIQLGVKRPRAEVMNMPYSLAKQARARKRIRKKNLRNAKLKRVRQECELLRLADELRAGGKRPVERVCSDCGRSWPKRREFYPFQDKKTDIGTSRHYKRRCRLCENARRRSLAKRDRRRSAPHWPTNC
jgi:hypothetical protein